MSNLTQKSQNCQIVEGLSLFFIRQLKWYVMKGSRLVFSDFTKWSFTFYHNADIIKPGQKSKDRGEKKWSCVLIFFSKLSSDLQKSLESTAIVFFQNIKIKLILEKFP
jgi:hypothetical protein